MVIADPEKILIDAALGRPPRTNLDAEEQTFRDKLDLEIAEIKSRGDGVEIPADIPDIEEPGP